MVASIGKGHDAEMLPRHRRHGLPSGDLVVIEFGQHRRPRRNLRILIDLGLPTLSHHTTQRAPAVDDRDAATQPLGDLSRRGPSRTVLSYCSVGNLGSLDKRQTLVIDGMGAFQDLDDCPRHVSGRCSRLHPGRYLDAGPSVLGGQLAKTTAGCDRGYG